MARTFGVAVILTIDDQDHCAVKQAVFEELVQRLKREMARGRNPAFMLPGMTLEMLTFYRDARNGTSDATPPLPARGRGGRLRLPAAARRQPVRRDPTAGGKTPVMATICKDAVGQWGGRVLILAHVRELLQQAADKLRTICPDVPFGVYSAGLKRATPTSR